MTTSVYFVYVLSGGVGLWQAVLTVNGHIVATGTAPTQPAAEAAAREKHRSRRMPRVKVREAVSV